MSSKVWIKITGKTISYGGVCKSKKEFEKQIQMLREAGVK
jgi:hypothetical protein